MLQDKMCPPIPSGCYLSLFDCKLILLHIRLCFITFIIQEQNLLESATLQDFINLFITKQIIVSSNFH